MKRFTRGGRSTTTPIKSKESLLKNLRIYNECPVCKQVIKDTKFVVHVEMHWVKSRRTDEQFDSFLRRVYKSQLIIETEIAEELPMPKSIKLVDDGGKELPKNSHIRNRNRSVFPHLVLEFDSDEEAREFVLAIRNDSIKLCKAIIDLYAQKELLGSFEPRIKPQVEPVSDKEDAEEN